MNYTIAACSIILPMLHLHDEVSEKHDAHDAASRKELCYLTREDFSTVDRIDMMTIKLPFFVLLLNAKTASGIK